MQTVALSALTIAPGSGRVFLFADVLSAHVWSRWPEHVHAELGQPALARWWSKAPRDEGLPQAVQVAQQGCHLLTREDRRQVEVGRAQAGRERLAQIVRGVEQLQVAQGQGTWPQ